MYNDQKWKLQGEASKPGFFYLVNHGRGTFITKDGDGDRDISARASSSPKALWRLARIGKKVRIFSVQYPGHYMVVRPGGKLETTTKKNDVNGLFEIGIFPKGKAP